MMTVFKIKINKYQEMAIRSLFLYKISFDWHLEMSKYLNVQSHDTVSVVTKRT